MAKKVIQEQVVVESDATAIDTLHPDTKPAADPKAMPHIERLAGIIGAFAAEKDETTKLKFYNDMMAWSHKAGTGPGVDDNSGKNVASIKAGDGTPKSGNPTAFSNPGAHDPHHSFVSQHQGDTGHVTPGDKTMFSNPGAPDKAKFAVKEAIKQDVADLLGTEQLTEDFKSKATTLFEAAINARVGLELVRLQTENEERIEKEVDEVVEGITEHFDAFCEFAVEQWMKANEVAIESALRNEIAEEFITGLRGLFEASFIDVPETKFDVVESLANKVSELETRLTEAIEENAELRAVVVESKKHEVFEEVSAGLTVVETEKFRTLAEDLDDEGALETFKTKLQTIRASYFKKSVPNHALTEQLDNTDPHAQPLAEEVVYTDANVRAYADAISRTSRK